LHRPRPDTLPLPKKRHAITWERDDGALSAQYGQFVLESCHDGISMGRDIVRDRL
jgi:hypothetical protein